MDDAEQTHLWWIHYLFDWLIDWLIDWLTDSGGTWKLTHRTHVLQFFIYALYVCLYAHIYESILKQMQAQNNERKKAKNWWPKGDLITKCLLLACTLCYDLITWWLQSYLIWLITKWNNSSWMLMMVKLIKKCNHLVCLVLESAQDKIPITWCFTITVLLALHKLTK